MFHRGQFQSMKPEPDLQLARDFLARHDNLGPLAHRAADLIEMRRVYRANMPPGLIRESEVANFRRAILIVGAKTSAAAAKIRQLAPRLITLYREKGWQVSAIQVQVQDRVGP